MKGLKNFLGAFTAVLLGFVYTGNSIGVSENKISCVNAEETETTEWDGTADTSWYDSEESTFYISNASELAGLARIVNSGNAMKEKTIIIDNDIVFNDVSTFEEWNEKVPRYGWTPLKSFEGTIDGSNHCITGIYSNGSFIKSASGAKIVNLKFQDIYIYSKSTTTTPRKSDSYLSGIVGLAENSIITNCIVDGVISVSNYVPSSTLYLGGIIGNAINTNIFDCENYVTINNAGQWKIPTQKEVETYGEVHYVNNARCYIYSVPSYIYMGGICGSLDDGSFIVNCINSGNLTSRQTSNSSGDKITTYTYSNPLTVCIGGISGDSSGYIVNCKNEGKIANPVSVYESLIGGIGGKNTGTLKNIYNVADLSYGSGIVGGNFGNVISAYNVGKTGSSSLIGKHKSDGNNVLEKLYYLSGTAVVGVGNTSDGIAKNKDNMKKESFAESLGDGFYYVEDDFPKLLFEKGVNIFVFLDKTTIAFKQYGEEQSISLTTNCHKDPVWKSSDESVATVDNNGNVRAEGVGSTVITVDCDGTTESCSVSVGYDFYLNKTELKLKEKRKVELKVYSAEDDSLVDNSRIKWSSSDDKIATVDDNGNVTTVKVGTAVITASVEGIDISCEVVVLSSNVGTNNNSNVKGDIIEDGKVNSSDVLKLIQYLNAQDGSEIKNIKLADLNDDNIINILDLILLKNKVLS